MEVNGLLLPDAFVRALAQNTFGTGAVWHPLDGIDAYGRRLAVGLAEVYRDEAALLRATARVAIGFEPDGWYGARTPRDGGGLPDIVDFARIICFGSSPDGEPFCFDYRKQRSGPTVICWDGEATVWRQLAPDFTTFLAIFGLRLHGGEPDR